MNQTDTLSRANAKIDLLREMGYRINYEKLHEEYTAVTRKPLESSYRNFYEIMAPYLVLAHERGRQNRALSDTFHFLEVLG